VTAAAETVRVRHPWGAAVLVAGSAAAVLGAAVWLEFDATSLFGPKAWRAFANVGSRLWPPNVESEILQLAAVSVLETLAISILGTLLASLVAFLLMPFACRSLLVAGPMVEEEAGRRPLQVVAWGVHQVVRWLANLLRTIPFLIWAMLFVYMVGLGPFSGMLAIALHTGGVLVRLYGMALDDLDPRPLQALRASGASRFHVFVYGMVPAVRPAVVSYTLYRWEVNIREAAVLGLVGAGGLGFHVKKYMGWFDWHSMSTFIAGMILMVIAVDFLSAWLRKRLV
jgi:phosphonate transport system permease protein